MKMLKMMFNMCFGKKSSYAKLTDIKGRKSGGTRDSNKNDWYQSGNA